MTRPRHPETRTATATPPTGRSRRLRRAAIVAAVSTALLAIVYAVVCVVAASILTKGTHRPLDASASEVGSDVDTVTFPSRIDHLTLSGWLAHSPAHSGRSVIMVHGRDSNRAAHDYGAIPMARDLLAHGDDVLMFDLRSSGLSQGDRYTLGQDEPRDLLGAYDFMRSRGYAPARMGVLGWSEGAVTVIEAASQLRPVAALVADSAFADLRPILATQIPKNDPLPRFFDWGSILAARLLFGFNPDLRPVDAVRALPDRAFLFFQGGADDTVPPDNADTLRRASANPASSAVVIPGAGHVQGFKTDTTRYLRTLFAFLDAQVAAHGG